MHKYLRAIGFSQCKSKKQLVSYLQKTMENKDSITDCTYKKADGSVFIEVKTFYGDDFGIIWSGNLIDGTEFELEYITPFLAPSTYIHIIQPSMERKKDIESYLGICDELRIETSLIYQIQNTRDCIKLIESNAEVDEADIGFVGLSTSGSILLPIKRADVNNIDDLNEKAMYFAILDAARKGNEDAITYLTLKDMDKHSQLLKRIQHEDVLSIVDSTFMPYGIETDVYTVVCLILYVEVSLNISSGEIVYILTVIYNAFPFKIIINKCDLTGEPKPGRRFKGNIWLQGDVRFK